MVVNRRLTDRLLKLNGLLLSVGKALRELPFAAGALSV